MVFKQPDKNEFEQVKQLVEEFWLFNENMQPKQFSILSDKGRVIAFGRLIEHSEATELCTMGVAKEFQKKGLGEKMVEHLIRMAKRDVYLVTILPGFFAKSGFKVVQDYPDSLRKKVEICTKEYHVEEPYFVMKCNIQ